MNGYYYNPGFPELQDIENGGPSPDGCMWQILAAIAILMILTITYLI